jgi:hypothetical protein
MPPQTMTATIDTVEGSFTFETHNPATLNQIWGQVLSEMGQAGIVGEHTSAHGAFISQPRDGVGNVSMDAERFQFDIDGGDNYSGLSDGSQGGHALFQSMLFGSDGLPPDIVEAQIEPIYPHDSGAFTVIPPEDHIL